MIRWHRAGWGLFWRLKSRPGRPPIPQQLQALIRRMANENPSWGEERIANELLLKLGVRVSPRTIRKYLPPRPPRQPRSDLPWATFLRLHAQGIIVCDFLVVVTARFRLLYVLVVIEHRSRRLVHCNVTAHPTAASPALDDAATARGRRTRKPTRISASRPRQYFRRTPRRVDCKARYQGIEIPTPCPMTYAICARGTF